MERDGVEEKKQWEMYSNFTFQITTHYITLSSILGVALMFLYNTLCKCSYEKDRGYKLINH